MTEPVNKQTLFSFFQHIVLLFFCHIYDMVHVTSHNFSVKTAAGSRFQRKKPPKQHYMLPAQHFCNAEEARAVNPCDSECFFLAIWNKTWCYNCAFEIYPESKSKIMLRKSGNAQLCATLPLAWGTTWNCRPALCLKFK